MSVTVLPSYASINAVANICEPWFELWGGDEWGESMRSLHGACHTNYGFSDEDCALFASKLMENLERMREWVDDEGKGIYDPVDEVEVRTECRRLRDYWLDGGNLKDEKTKEVAKKTIDSMPSWLFEGGEKPPEDPPLPQSVQEILQGHLTGAGVEAWWKSYVRMDPFAQEGHAQEHARRFIAGLVGKRS